MAYYFKKSIMALWIIIGIDMSTRLITSYVIYRSKDIYSGELLIKDEWDRKILSHLFML